MEELKSAKASHHKFSFILLACAVLTHEVTWPMKEAVMQGAREQLGCIPPLDQIIEKVLTFDLEFMTVDQALLAELLLMKKLEKQKFKLVICLYLWAKAIVKLYWGE